MLVIRAKIGGRAAAGEPIGMVGVRHVETAEAVVGLRASGAKMNLEAGVLREAIVMMVLATSVAVNRGDRKRRSWISRLILCRTHKVWSRLPRKFD